MNFRKNESRESKPTKCLDVCEKGSHSKAGVAKAANVG